MIVSKTPLRIPLAGGLTDVEPYASRHGGVTVSSTIDRFVHVTVEEPFDGVFDLRYGDVHERTRSAERLHHHLTREALKLAGLEGTPLRIAISADLPSESGLGSSGAVTVGLLHAFHRVRGERPSPQRLLEEACRIEVDVLQGASGYHDPAICALGGLQRIEYRGRDVRARPVPMGDADRARFERSLMLFYSGRHEKSKPSLALLSSRMEEADAEAVLHDIRALGYALDEALAAGDLARAAEIVGEQQALKQRLPGSFVDDYVVDLTERVRATGAAAQLPGGKISAFVLVVCPDGQQDAVRRALPDLREVPLRLEPAGTRAAEI